MVVGWNWRNLGRGLGLHRIFLFFDIGTFMVFCYCTEIITLLAGGGKPGEGSGG